MNWTLNCRTKFTILRDWPGRSLFDPTAEISGSKDEVRWNARPTADTFSGGRAEDRWSKLHVSEAEALRQSVNPSFTDSSYSTVWRCRSELIIPNGAIVLPRTAIKESVVARLMFFSIIICNHLLENTHCDIKQDGHPRTNLLAN